VIVSATFAGLDLRVDFTLQTAITSKTKLAVVSDLNLNRLFSCGFVVSIQLHMGVLEF